MKRSIYSIFILMWIWASCNNAQSESKRIILQERVISQEADTGMQHINIRLSKFEMKKDPVCKMPLKIHIADTASYKGKLYGFCSTECKDVFLKKPLSYLDKK